MAQRLNETDLLNKKFGSLTILAFVDRINGKLRVKCQCDCGNETIVKYNDLQTNRTYNCGCKRVRDLTGHQYGNLTVLERASENIDEKAAWKCQCNCGKVVTIRSSSLVNGQKSCGCIIGKHMNLVQNQEEVSERKFEGYGEISLKQFNSYKRGAETRNLEFKVTIEELWDLFLKQERKCGYTGVELTFPKRGCANKTASLDRKDSSKGYVLENVHWVHKNVNAMKMDLDEKDFINLCNLVGCRTKNKKNKIFITGGCGFLGKALIEKWYNRYEMVIFNRDENKQFFLKRAYPNIEYKLGDVNDLDMMRRASEECSYGVFAASMKHIDACSNNPEQASRTILQGAINSRKISEENNFISGCFISSDKSQSPSTLYGALKLAASESFILNSTNLPKLNSLSYGNIFASSGSIVIKLNDIVSKKTDEVLELFHPEMTRFGMHVNQAVAMIEDVLFGDYQASTIVPKLWSYRIIDLFEIYKEKFGIEYNISKLRPGEKKHEIMIPEHSMARTMYDPDKKYYVISQSDYYENNSLFATTEYSSKNCLITKYELLKYLEQYNFFKSE